MVKAGPDSYQNKNASFRPVFRVIQEVDKEKESMRFLRKKWF